ncbi:hypothetical protein AB1Y20_008485 [Prymnesium parvum]|uniref:Uncharacterized protein n=1 Tax=Prymnesium parvum TaxID=97485 RepID=A0AB34IQF9_PRYPA
MEVDSDGDEILTPASMRKELKRLRQLTTHTAAPAVDATGSGRRVVRRGRGNRAETEDGVHNTALPDDELTDLTAEVLPSAGRSDPIRIADLLELLLRRVVADLGGEAAAITYAGEVA